MESRKEFEERLMTELLNELKVEPLCNILQYAASYLKGEQSEITRPIDERRAEILERYAAKMETRVREARR
jgi:hypothetical protein